MAAIVIFSSNCSTTKEGDQLDVPKPEVTLKEMQDPDTTGTDFFRYCLTIDNWHEYPYQLFRFASDLPPCGHIVNASRMWVQVHDVDDERLLKRFCAFSNPEDLQTLWFAVREGRKAPKKVYVLMRDRRTGIDYKSEAIPMPNPPS